MKELFINRAKTCAITGHRVLEKGFNKEKVREIFIKLFQAGFDTFLIGMALGFDTECFKILEDLKKENKIFLIACVPCKTQSYRFTKEQKNEYDRMLSVADEVVLVSEEYSKTCMQKRNQYMVDNCSVLLAYLRRDFGGTKNTVNYAIKRQVQIIKI